MSTVKTSFRDDSLPQPVLERLENANRALGVHFPGDTGKRQPVHTVYGGAQLFKSDTAAKMGGIAARALSDYAKDGKALALALGIPEADHGLFEKVYPRVVEKLGREAVEDFRIDFEDGYGNRPDAEEDKDAARTALEVAKGMKEGTLSPFIGIRIKPFTEELKARSFRTLDIFVTTLAEATGGHIPANFVVTIPKVTVPEQVETLVALLEVLEESNKIKPHTLKLELMIETTQSILDAHGRATIPALLAAANGRCTGAHFGTYDYTASCDITAEHQSMIHGVCDFAKHVMKVTLAGTGVMLSDGATNVMPVGPHRAAKDGPALTAEQQRANSAVVHRAWKMAYEHIEHSLVNGFYQGWDLHPAQLPIRYAAVFVFFLRGLEPAGHRLRSFMDKAAQATLVGDVFDDAATGQGLLNYFLRSMSCGALTPDEAQRMSGLTLDELKSRSFAAILKGRRG